MSPVIEVAYVGIQVPDPAVLTPFFGDVIGLLPGAPTAEGAVTWRNDDRVHRVLVEPGPADDAVFVGIEVGGTDGSFDAAVARLAHAGFAPEVDAALAAGRCVARLARVTSPWGVTFEVVEGLERVPGRWGSETMPGGFLTEGVGFGHVVFATPAFDEATRFLIDGLGFARSDWLELPISEDVQLEVGFFHCNARHHSVALARAPFRFPQQLHHLMFETKDRDDVGAAFDRAWASGLPIPNGLGVHDNDRMFSFYVQSPAGFQVEVGHGARSIGVDWDDDRRYDRISLWGHQPLRTG